MRILNGAKLLEIDQEWVRESSTAIAEIGLPRESPWKKIARKTGGYKTLGEMICPILTPGQRQSFFRGPWNYIWQWAHDNWGEVGDDWETRPTDTRIRAVTTARTHPDILRNKLARLLKAGGIPVPHGLVASPKLPKELPRWVTHDNGCVCDSKNIDHAFLRKLNLDISVQQLRWMSKGEPESEERQLGEEHED